MDPWPRGHWMMIHQISNLTLQIDFYPAGHYLVNDFTSQGNWPVMLPLATLAVLRSWSTMALMIAFSFSTLLPLLFSTMKIKL